MLQIKSLHALGYREACAPQLRYTMQSNKLKNKTKQTKHRWSLTSQCWWELLKENEDWKKIYWTQESGGSLVTAKEPPDMLLRPQSLSSLSMAPQSLPQDLHSGRSEQVFLIKILRIPWQLFWLAAPALSWDQASLPMSAYISHLTHLTHVAAGEPEVSAGCQKTGSLMPVKHYSKVTHQFLTQLYHLSRSWWKICKWLKLFSNL